MWSSGLVDRLETAEKQLAESNSALNREGPVLIGELSVRSGVFGGSTGPVFSLDWSYNCMHFDWLCTTCKVKSIVWSCFWHAGCHSERLFGAFLIVNTLIIRKDTDWWTTTRSSIAISIKWERPGKTKERTKHKNMKHLKSSVSVCKSFGHCRLGIIKQKWAVGYSCSYISCLLGRSKQSSRVFVPSHRS